MSTKDIAQATSSTFLPGIENQSYGSTQPPASASEGTHSKMQRLRACFNNTTRVVYNLVTELVQAHMIKSLKLSKIQF